LERKHPRLIKALQEPVLLLDETASTGLSLDTLREFLNKEMGAKSVHTAAFSAAHKMGLEKSPDFLGSIIDFNHSSSSSVLYISRGKIKTKAAEKLHEAFNELLKEIN
ncbi:hypothetical protein HY993_02615, partial [Candidatus Micrarchaeota archaeon]|nr:hypothetical protein [Candidatus Micrarchaeota archaeon]